MNGQVVYFAERNGLVKIGTTSHLARRLRQIKATLLGFEPGGFSEEAALHRQFADFRVEGEWFEPVVPLLERIPCEQLPLPEFIPASEAARHLQWCTKTVKKACHQGMFDSQRTPGGHLRVRAVDVHEYAKGRRPT